MGDVSSRSREAAPAPFPPESVLRAWRLEKVEPLPGGQGEAFRTGNLVLKPAPEPERSARIADALDGVTSDEMIRLARPERSVDGAWVVDGRAAWQWLEGVPWEATLPELLEVSRRFHRTVAHVPWQPEMQGIDRWAVADRIAWGEIDQELVGSLGLLAGERHPVALASQFIHGDIHGNVLQHPEMDLSIIDISPYWRPAAYGDAIIQVDHAIAEPLRQGLVPEMLGRHGRQLLIRAVLFRALSEPEPSDAYEPLVEQLLARE